MKIKFTYHALFSIKKRKITEDEVIQTITSPEKLYKVDGKYYAQKNIGRGKIEVVYERETYINAITVYWA